MTKRQRFDKDHSSEVPLTVDGKSYQSHDTYLIGEIGVRDAMMYEFLYKTVDDKFVWLTIIADDDQTFGNVKRGFRVARYVPEEFALSLRKTWAIIRDDQPSLLNVDNYFDRIRAIPQR